MLKLVQRIILILFIICPVAQSAERVSDLYEAHVPVTGGEDINAPVVKEALRKVLVKVTGQSNFDDFPLVQNALDEAKNYVREFGFHTIEVPTTLEEKQRLGTEVRSQRVMRVVFLRGALLQLIRSAGLGLWSQNRPSVLVWLALDDYAQQQWVTQIHSTHVARQLQYMANERGLPLTLPKGDLDDDFALQPAELFARDYSRINTASIRYKPDVVLSGQAVQTSAGLWIGNWRYVIDDEEYSYEVLEAKPEDFLAVGLMSLIDKLAQKYVVVSNGHHSTVSMRVAGLQTFADYANVDRYLNGLAAIESANLSSVDGDVSVFQVQLNGSIDQLDNALALDKKLSPIADLSLTHTYDLQYQWLGADQ